MKCFFCSSELTKLIETLNRFGCLNCSQIEQMSVQFDYYRDVKNLEIISFYYKHENLSFSYFHYLKTQHNIFLIFNHHINNTQEFKIDGKLTPQQFKEKIDTILLLL